MHVTPSKETKKKDTKKRREEEKKGSDERQPLHRTPDSSSKKKSKQKARGRSLATKDLVRARLLTDVSEDGGSSLEETHPEQTANTAISSVPKPL